mgnify:CR=1 FL=1
MKIFIFENVSELTDRYHSDGGLAVIAKDRKHAEKMTVNVHIEITESEWEDVIVYDLKHEEEPRMYIFPDAGCC